MRYLVNFGRTCAARVCVFEQGQQCVLCVVQVALCVLASAQECASHCATLHLRGSPCKFDAIDTVRDIRPHSAVGSVIILIVVVVVTIDDDNNIESASAVVSKSITRLSLAVAKKWVGAV